MVLQIMTVAYIRHKVNHLLRIRITEMIAAVQVVVAQRRVLRRANRTSGHERLPVPQVAFRGSAEIQYSLIKIKIPK